MTNNSSKQNRNWLPLLLPAACLLVILVGLDHFGKLGGDRAKTDINKSARNQRSSPPLPAHDSSSPATNGMNPLGRLALSDLSDITERPLFEPSRRAYVNPVPPVVVAAEIKAPPVDPNMFALIGVVTSKDRTTALLLYRPSGRHVRLQLGGDFEGWVVRSIEPQAVILQKSGVDITVSLFKK